jgi:hypothetical protein
MAKNLPSSINFLNPASKPDSEVNNILNWILVWGKLITLVSSAFLVGVFAYRVYIDTRRSVLEEDLADKYANAERTYDKQVYYSHLQQVLSDIESLEAEQLKISDRNFVYLEYLKNNEEVKDFSLNYQNANFEIKFDSIVDMYEMETEMNKDNRIDNQNTEFKVEEKAEDIDPKVEANVTFETEDTVQAQ